MVPGPDCRAGTGARGAGRRAETADLSTPANAVRRGFYDLTRRYRPGILGLRGLQAILLG